MSRYLRVVEFVDGYFGIAQITNSSPRFVCINGVRDLDGGQINRYSYQDLIYECVESPHVFAYLCKTPHKGRAEQELDVYKRKVAMNKII